MKAQTTPRIDPEIEARRDRNSQALCDMDGHLGDAQIFADLAMSWWLKLNEERTGELADSKGITLSERERQIVSFAFGELWQRLGVLNAIADVA